MSEFFHGWRRKVGVPTLLMACILMAGWVRSSRKLDFLRLPVPLTGWSVSIESASGFIQLRLDGDNAHSEFGYFPTELKTYLIYYSDYPLSTFEYEWYSAGDSRPTDCGIITLFPYWSVILLPTLLSAYLLLSKPRKSTPMKINEPIPCGVT
jgi:hypothetical protein